MVPNATSTARCRDPITNDLASDVEESSALEPEPEEELDEVEPAACELDVAEPEPEEDDAAAELDVAVALASKTSDTDSTVPVVPSAFWYGLLRPSSSATEFIFQLCAAMRG